MTEEPAEAGTLLSLLEQDERDLLAKLALLRAEIASIAPHREQSKWLDFGSLLRSRGALGDRYATGLPTLDEKLEGGLFRPSLITVQGRPGIGKTLLATQIALSLGRHCAVAALFRDEGPLGASVTIGQQLGFNRTKLLENDPCEQASAIKALGELAPNWHFLNPIGLDATIEFLSEDFQRLVPEGMPQVWLLDSAQVVRSRTHKPDDKQRDRVMKAYATAREAAEKRGAIVLMVSKANRASYASKNDDENVDPIAAGMDSADIEYQSEAIFHLQGKPTKTSPKAQLMVMNKRLSAEGDFRVPLRLDYSRKRYLEADLIEEEQEVAQAIEIQTKTDAGRILAVLNKSPKLSTRSWRDASGMKSQRFDAARKWLAESHQVFFETGARNSILWYPGKQGG